MAGKPQEKAIRAMLAVIDEGIPALTAAQRVGMSPCSLYVSVLYKAWKAAHGDSVAVAAVRADLMQRKKELAAVARRRRKPTRKGIS